MQSFSHPEGATFGSATRSPERFDSLESPMLKEKDLRGFKKRLKGYESQKLLGQASRSALLLTTFGRPVPDLGSQAFTPGVGAVDRPVVIPAYFKIVQFLTDVQRAPRINCSDRRSDIEM